MSQSSCHNKAIQRYCTQGGDERSETEWRKNELENVEKKIRCRSSLSKLTLRDFSCNHRNELPLRDVTQLGMKLFAYDY